MKTKPLTLLLALTFLFLFSGSSVVFASAPGPQGYGYGGVWATLILIILGFIIHYNNVQNGMDVNEHGDLVQRDWDSEREENIKRIKENGRLKTKEEMDKEEQDLKEELEEEEKTKPTND